MRAGDCRRNQQEVAWLIMRQFEEFRRLKATHQPVLRVQFRPKWSRPPVGFVKINVDSGFIEERAQGSWGYIIRDDVGEVLPAGAGRLNHVLEAWQAAKLNWWHAFRFR